MKESNVRDITINLISTFNPSHLCGLGAGCPDICFLRAAHDALKDPFAAIGAHKTFIRDSRVR